jgi:hypothetical protein
MTFAIGDLVFGVVVLVFLMLLLAFDLGFHKQRF